MVAARWCGDYVSPRSIWSEVTISSGFVGHERIHSKSQIYQKNCIYDIWVINVFLFFFRGCLYAVFFLFWKSKCILTFFFRFHKCICFDKKKYIWAWFFQSRLEQFNGGGFLGGSNRWYIWVCSIEIYYTQALLLDDIRHTAYNWIINIDRFVFILTLFENELSNRIWRLSFGMNFVSVYSLGIVWWSGPGSSRWFCRRGWRSACNRGGLA